MYTKPPLYTLDCEGELANNICANHIEEEAEMVVAALGLPVDHDSHQPHRLNHEPGKTTNQHCILQEGHASKCIIV